MIHTLDLDKGLEVIRTASTHPYDPTIWEFAD